MIRGRWRARLAALSLLALAFYSVPTAAMADAGDVDVVATIDVPADVDASKFSVHVDKRTVSSRTYVFNRTFPSHGPLYIDVLEPGQEYLLEIASNHPGHFGGWYAGPGVPLAELEANAVAVTTADDVVITPEAKQSISARLEVNAPALEYSTLYVDFHRVKDGARDVTRITVLPGSREFTFTDARAGASYEVQVLASGEYWGYNRTGARGLVEEAFATKVGPGAAITIPVLPATVAPNVISMGAPAVSGSPVVGNALSVSAGTWDPASATPLSLPPSSSPRSTERTSMSRMCGAATSPARASSSDSSTSRPTNAWIIAEASTTITVACPRERRGCPRCSDLHRGHARAAGSRSPHW